MLFGLLAYFCYVLMKPSALRTILIVALIAMAMVGALRTLGGGAGGMWTNLAQTADDKM